MYKIPAWVIIFIFTLAGVGCQPRETAQFAIYLLADDIPATELSTTNLDDVTLQAHPILSANDLVSYNRVTHEMELSDTAYRRIQGLFPTPVKVNGIPFIVTLGKNPVYAGAFWTPLSSLSYDGVVIMQPFNQDEPVIRIVLGYPGPDAFTGNDPRADSRVMDVLQATGKLH